MARRNALAINNLLNPESNGNGGRSVLGVANLLNPEPTVNLYHGRVIKVKYFSR